MVVGGVREAWCGVVMSGVREARCGVVVGGVKDGVVRHGDECSVSVREVW